MPKTAPSIVLACDYAMDYLGGAQTAFVRQARALAGEGWRVTVVAPGAERAFAGVDGVTAVSPRTLFTLPGVDLPVLAPRAEITDWLAQVARVVRADAIGVHSEFTLAAAALTAAKKLGIPMLHTVHTFFWTAPRALAPAAPLVSLVHRHVTGLGGSGRLPATAIDSALRNMTLRVAVRADAVLSPSRHQAEALRRAGAVRARAFSNVATPLDVAPARPDGPLEVLWAARFAPEKRLEVALDAMPLVRNALGEDAVKLHVAGGDLPAAPGITVHGRVSPDEMAALLGATDAAVLTSVGFDNQPMVALEAFSRGRPVIVSDPVLGEEFGEAAITADATDAAGLAATLIRLDGDRAALRAASSHAISYAEGNQPARHAAALAEIIREGRASGTTRTSPRPPRPKR